MSGAGKGRVDAVEWVVGILSALAVAALLGMLALHAIRETEALPDLQIAPLTDGPSDPFHLRFAVRNQGARTAEDVTIALVLDGSGAPDKRTMTIDFVPAQSEVTGAFLLEDAAQARSARLLVESYLDP